MPSSLFKSLWGLTDVISNSEPESPREHSPDREPPEDSISNPAARLPPPISLNHDLAHTGLTLRSKYKSESIDIQEIICTPHWQPTSFVGLDQSYMKVNFPTIHSLSTTHQGCRKHIEEPIDVDLNQTGKRAMWPTAHESPATFVDSREWFD
ncbi:hypothetical protein RhiXN_11439 [Rhizoctonia solani]|uniref:Uncharacterized protein n=1 Tax=Rhizoctonia solani TaxID=456999 RepID=A0A8H8P6N6_9AGAM|nr:uncharacterized protein RhiXN_11439 [Rhizoctonia solani]QRW24527.1 hypothetical protein RhiXN_11439 [Rhizoctonia solani]